MNQQDNQETPWVSLGAVCHMYGVALGSAKNKIMAGTFPVMTYKVGKIHVIDRAVHDRYFACKREAGLCALESTNG